MQVIKLLALLISCLIMLRIVKNTDLTGSVKVNKWTAIKFEVEQNIQFKFEIYLKWTE